VSVKDGSIVPKGCLIGDRVVIGPGAKLTPFERLSSSKRAERRDEDDEKGAVDDQEEDDDDDSDMEEVEASKSGSLPLPLMLIVDF
jgi:translation initiation factor eIF-2B subunit epsilon